MHFGETGMEMVDDGFIDNSLDQAEGTSVSKELYVISPVLPSAWPHTQIGKYIYILHVGKIFKVCMIF